MRIGSILLLVWLVIGAAAAAQRHYFSSSEANCAEVSATVLTIVAGPLNYVGVNPAVKCNTPQPSS